MTSHILHFEKMRQVESLLRQYLESNLPDLETIARQVALGVSTLKRHFAVMYGKSHYDYYLGMKMNHARHLLTEKHYSVNEVAAILHYEKVSSFIDMFKKHHGISPGALQKQEAG